MLEIGRDLVEAVKYSMPESSSIGLAMDCEFDAKESNSPSLMQRFADSYLRRFRTKRAMLEHPSCRHTVDIPSRFYLV